MLEIGEKVVPLVIDDDERREVLDIDLAHGLHASSGKSTTSTDLMEFFARIAAGPPIEPR